MFASLCLASLFLSACSGQQTITRPSPKPYDECDKPSDEFFYLVQFTIHGFWPNYCQDRRGIDWPEYCTRERYNEEAISDLIPTMDAEWPSLTAGNSEFWEHEWKKHGTCALNYTAFGLDSQREYFETTLELHKANDLFNVLSDHDIMPGGSYSVDEIEAAIEESLGGDAYLHCQGSQNTLVEIYICYNQRLERVPCSRQGVCKRDAFVNFVLPEDHFVEED